MVLGLLTAGRTSSPRWPGFARAELHKRLSAATLVFLAIHVLTSVVDTYVAVGWASIVLPFDSGYHRFWTGLGTVGVDLLVAVDRLERGAPPHPRPAVACPALARLRQLARGGGARRRDGQRHAPHPRRRTGRRVRRLRARGDGVPRPVGSEGVPRRRAGRGEAARRLPPGAQRGHRHPARGAPRRRRAGRHPTRHRVDRRLRCRPRSQPHRPRSEHRPRSQHPLAHRSHARRYRSTARSPSAPPAPRDCWPGRSAAWERACASTSPCTGRSRSPPAGAARRPVATGVGRTGCSTRSRARRCPAGAAADSRAPASSARPSTAGRPRSSSTRWKGSRRAGRTTCCCVVSPISSSTAPSSLRWRRERRGCSSALPPTGRARRC